MTTTTLVLARHGLTDWNVERRFQGHLDPPLNDLGREQSRELASRLAELPLHAIYTSDLARAYETAKIIAESRGLAVIPDRGLREVDVGSWAGLTRDEVGVRFPDVARHDGESDDELFERVHACVLRIASEHRGQTVLVISHGGALRTLRRRVLGVESIAPLGNCEMYTLHFDGQLRDP